ncbi:protein SRC1-like [Forsythia ovata]|uniref:Protein SRC1-like n=1 Tax=Forsythia ovata TaxID=205694 RepID=A0ABD1WW55_9LAMI
MGGHKEGDKQKYHGEEQHKPENGGYGCDYKPEHGRYGGDHKPKHGGYGGDHKTKYGRSEPKKWLVEKIKENIYGGESEHAHGNEEEKKNHEHGHNQTWRIWL